MNRSTFGELFDHVNNVTINLISNQVIIKNINGSSDTYTLDTTDLSQAIQNNKGNTKKYLILIKQVLL